MRRVIIVSIIIIAALLAGVYVYHYVGENKTSESTTLPLVGIMSDENLLKVIPIEIDPQRKEVSYGDALLSIKPGALLGLYTSSGKLFAYVDPTIDEHYKVSGDIYILEKYHLPNACLPSHVFSYAGGLSYICGEKVYLFDGRDYTLIYDLEEDTNLADMPLSLSHQVTSSTGGHVEIYVIGSEPMIIDHIQRTDSGSVYLYFHASLYSYQQAYVRVGIIVLPPEVNKADLKVYYHDMLLTEDDISYIYFVYYSDEGHTWRVLRFDTLDYTRYDAKELLQRIVEMKEQVQAPYFYQVLYGSFVSVRFSKKPDCHPTSDEEDIPADLSLYRQTPFLDNFIREISWGKDGPVVRTFHINGYLVRWYVGLANKG
ncbi:MAG: hypothetical protein GXO59_03265, partial [Dictyoglomi bacterium]|nr:hypothetical protein [Dictyoglomota bacterium]